MTCALPVTRTGCAYHDQQLRRWTHERQTHERRTHELVQVGSVGGRDACYAAVRSFPGMRMLLVAEAAAYR